jgi:hypothetical protein
MKFTNQEYADLHLLYGETRRNSRPARRPYGERFPEGVLPSRCTFVELHLHLKDLEGENEPATPQPSTSGGPFPSITMASIEAP